MNNSIVKFLLRRILPSLVIFGIVFWLGYVKGEMVYSVAIVFSYWCMSIPWGWGKVGDWLGRRRFTLSGGVGDAFYWASRIFLSVLLGGILFPIEVIKFILAFNKAKKVDSDIEPDSTGANNGL
jgi:hypothetical protein